jgi:hypothetical protein
VVARRDLPVRLHVGDVGELVIFEAVRLPLADFPQAQVERAELLRIGDLLVLAELLPAKDQHRVAVHAGDDFRHLRWGERLREVEALGFGGEQRVQRREAQRHQLAVIFASFTTRPHVACSLRM